MSRTVHVEGPLVWHVAPEDQGQIVEVAWADAGEQGALCRVTDRSDRSVSYRLHQWRYHGPDFAAWNGCPIASGAVSRRSRPVELIQEAAR